MTSSRAFGRKAPRAWCLPRLRARRRGMAVVWVAVLGVLLISLVGLAMDAAVVQLGASHLQVAADAASLAGAQLVRDVNPLVPRGAAQTIALSNKALGTPVNLDLNAANGADGDIVLGRYYRFSNSSYCASPDFCCGTPPCFDPLSLTPNAVRVRARRVSGKPDGQIGLIFGAMPGVGVTGVDVARTATAMIQGGTGAGLITLDPSGECTLEISGNVTLDLTSAPGWLGDTAAQINSTDSSALCGNGDFIFRAPETNIVGSDPGYDFEGNPTIDTFLNADSPDMPDPLADLDPPPIGLDLGAIDPPASNPPVAVWYPPGYYSGGMNIKGTQSVVLGPGIYVVEGSGNQGGFQSNGTGSVIANNVMIYIKSGKLDLSGTGVTTITPMTDEINTNTDYIGVAIFQARDNTAPARIIGTADMDLQGTYYFPNNLLEVGGTGIALGNQLIAWQLDLHGTGEFTIMYDGRFPSPGSKIFLVD